MYSGQAGDGLNGWLPPKERLRAIAIEAGNCENTRAAWQLFSQLGLEPNHTDLTAQSLFFLEESCRVKRSDTQTFSNFSKLLQKTSQASKTFFQLLQIKRLQLKLTNNLQNSYQISSQHQVPKTWVKQHPKTPKTTKTNEKFISKLFHAQTGSIWFQIGSYLVPIGSYGI